MMLSLPKDLDFSFCGNYLITENLNATGLIRDDLICYEEKKQP